jgi:hypothetical protein
LGRGGFDETVTSADLSAGGVLLRADDRLGVGDVLELQFEIGGISLGLRGLVVATRGVAGQPHQRFVHVAFTGLDPDRLTTLTRLLEDWERETAEA